MSGTGQFIGWIMLVTIFGAMALWTWLDHREKRRDQERREMEEWAEPARFRRTFELPKDHVIDYDELPDDWKDWSWR